MLLTSGRMHARLSRGLNNYSYTYNSWGWDPGLRNPSGRTQGNGGKYPPRVTHLADLPISIIHTRPISLWTRMYKLFFGKKFTMDPMLHHDGWKETDGVDPEDSAIRWDFSFWKRHDVTNEQEEKQCVPMAEWQTTSYPNCNIGMYLSLNLCNVLFDKNQFK